MLIFRLRNSKYKQNSAGVWLDGCRQVFVAIRGVICGIMHVYLLALLCIWFLFMPGAF